ncbi:MAG: DUF370 domain-containing protein [Oscillospiraceae bacterium]|nr:DUF370 domain-containing protein [Oscillospiraceae bacterium]
MYLHLGNDNLVRKRDVIGVFDLDVSSQSHLTRAFLRAAEQSGGVLDASGGELPKSFVVCAALETGQRVCLSQLNASTLLRRSEGTGFE